MASLVLVIVIGLFGIVTESVRLPEDNVFVLEHRGVWRWRYSASSGIDVALWMYYVIEFLKGIIKYVSENIFQED
jgi:hypothetical protein